MSDQNKNLDLRFAPTQKNESKPTETNVSSSKIDDVFLKWVSNKKFTVIEPLKVATPHLQSRIYLCEKNGVQYVLQVFTNKTNEISSEVMKKIQSIESPYLQTWYETGRHLGYTYIITDYFVDGDTSRLLDTNRINAETIKKHLVPQMNEALRLLHSQNITHRDVKLTNILMEFNAKRFILADYGIAVDMREADFLESKDQAFTDGFSAPNADRIILKSNDYYSLGRVIEYLALNTNPDIGRRTKDIALENELGLSKISNTLDPEIADLIAMLKEVDPKKRAGYQEVEAWIKNPASFDGRRFAAQTTLNQYSFKNPIIFLDKAYDSLSELTQAWCLNWKKALYFFNQRSEEHHNELFKFLFPQWSPKQRTAFQKHFKGARTKYQEDMDALFFSCILFINPKQRFNYKEYIFGGLKGYIQYITQNPSQIMKIPYHNLLLQEVLDSEMTYYDPKNFADFLSQLITEKLEPISKKSLIYSYYKEYNETNLSFMVDGFFFKSKEDFTDFLFDNDGEPVDSQTLLSELFYLLLKDRFGWPSDQIKTIQMLKDIYQRNAELSKKFVGHIDFSRGNPPYKFYYFNNFVEYAAQEYAKPKKQRDLFVARYIQSDNLTKFITYSDFSPLQNDMKQKLLQFLKSLKKLKDLEEILVEFFQYTSQSKFFIFEGNKFHTLQEITDYLAKTKEIEKVSEALLNSAEFKIWWKAKGFPQPNEGGIL